MENEITIIIIKKPPQLGEGGTSSKGNGIYHLSCEGKGEVSVPQYPRKQYSILYMTPQNLLKKYVKHAYHKNCIFKLFYTRMFEAAKKLHYHP